MNLCFSDQKFGYEIETFRSERILKNKISDMILDMRNSLLNYNSCSLSKKLGLYFLMFLSYTIICILTSS